MDMLHFSSEWILSATTLLYKLLVLMRLRDAVCRVAYDSYYSGVLLV